MKFKKITIKFKIARVIELVGGWDNITIYTESLFTYLLDGI